MHGTIPYYPHPSTNRILVDVCIFRFVSFCFVSFCLFTYSFSPSRLISHPLPLFLLRFLVQVLVRTCGAHEEEDDDDDGGDTIRMTMTMTMRKWHGWRKTMITDRNVKQSENMLLKICVASSMGEAMY